MQSSLSHQIAPFHVMELVKQADALALQGHPVIHLSIGEPDFGTPPPVLEAYGAALQAHKTRYTAALGLMPLREAIAVFYQQQFDVAVNPQQIVVTSGASAALQFACLALLNPGDEVLLSDPGYPCNKTFVQAAGAQPRFVQTTPEQGFQPTVGDIMAAWQPHTRGALLASPNNPTGTRLNPVVAQQINQAIAERGGFLIMDEIYQSLCYGSPARSILQTVGLPDEHNRLLVINSFSKYFGMTGLRLGWMVVPEYLLGGVEKLAQNLSICPPAPAQWAALACFEQRTLDLCEERRQVLGQRRDFLLHALPKAGLQVDTSPDAAFYLYVRTPMDSDAYCNRLLNTHWVCAVPGKDFSPMRGHERMRLSYANSLPNIEQAVERIYAFNKTMGMV
ncbi:aminotransferase class I/II-fold pyridoxal phosphate-dependent enzyme [Limnobacter humi]|uniref:Aminotransferase n=1 Tax=Limnobacter humi TaxID=1778671 RepID=A0ABT1WHA5_9BURK|nr:aminotransferase class I/II-fold pyridoxal phosphate-dependent enzyme [Limnobacter humi]MCQ8896870.1 aminotransferase class I/II-fold pyridoxal phosphate-dependent enzyme [Limnobacter humi]